MHYNYRHYLFISLLLIATDTILRDIARFSLLHYQVSISVLIQIVRGSNSDGSNDIETQIVPSNYLSGLCSLSKIENIRSS